MAKMTITRACGHEEEVNIGGPHRDRERIAEYESTKLCSDCYKVKQPEKQPMWDLIRIDGAARMRIANSFSIKDELKSRGYSFDGFTRSWIKQLSTQDEVVAEYDFVNQFQAGDEAYTQKIIAYMAKQ